MSQSKKKNWIATDTTLLPDFIIGGAMKCGTSTLHAILNKHPKIFIPKEEVHFFDLDNLLQHSDFTFYHNKEWTTQSMDKNPALVWEWYQRKFEGKEAYVKGEDSTTYLASKIAAERILLQKKEIKIVFLLRQPSLRAYSNYKHLLRMGRMTYSFEDTIRFNPFLVLNRSLYKEQLAAYYEFLPRKNIKVILFEDLIKKTALTIAEVSKFIGIDESEFAKDAFEIHSNKGKEPRFSKLHEKKNLLLRDFGNIDFNNQLPFTPSFLGKSSFLVPRAINKIHRFINPQIPIRSSIKPETKQFLDRYFFDELQGIDGLVGKDIMSKWFADVC